MARFRSGTRYTNGIFTLDRSNKPFMVLREPLIIDESEDDTYITVEGGFENRPDLISYKVYKRADLGWAIMDINSIQNPFLELTLGVVLRIPSLSKILSAISKLNSDII